MAKVLRTDTTRTSSTTLSDFNLLTKSAHWAHSVIELRCPCVSMYVCMSVTSQNTLFQRLWRPLVWDSRLAKCHHPTYPEWCKIWEKFGYNLLLNLRCLVVNSTCCHKFELFKGKRFFFK